MHLIGQKVGNIMLQIFIFQINAAFLTLYLSKHPKNNVEQFPQPY